MFLERVSELPRSRGFTLLEILIAMLIMAIGMVGLAMMTMVIQRSNKFNQDFNMARTIAEETLGVFANNIYGPNWSYEANQLGSLAPALFGDSHAECGPQKADECFEDLPNLVPLALCPHDTVAYPNCIGPNEFASTRMFWIDGAFAEIAYPATPADPNQPTPNGTPTGLKGFRFDNPPRPFLTYYFINDTVIKGIPERKRITVVVLWMDKRQNQVRHVSMNTSRSIRR